MAFTVQDDSGTVVGANAYLTEAEMTTYFTDRGVDLSDFDSTALQAAIVLGSDYIDARFTYVGRRRNTQQSTEWPRTDAYDRDRNYVNGIPEAVKEACSEYAYRSLSGTLNPDPARDDTGVAIKSKAEKVGPLSEETVFADSAIFSLPKYPAADQKLVRLGLTIPTGSLRRG